MTGQTGNLIAIVRTLIEYFEDKSILTFLQCQLFIPEYVVAFRVRTEYTSFVHVSVLIILGNCDHFAFRPITSHIINRPVATVCLSHRSATASLTVLSCPICLSCFRVTQIFNNTNVHIPLFLSSRYGQTSTSLGLLTSGCGRAGSAECITKGSRCIGVVLIKTEMNVAGSSRKGRDSLSPKLCIVLFKSLTVGLSFVQKCTESFQLHGTKDSSLAHTTGSVPGPRLGHPAWGSAERSRPSQARARHSQHSKFALFQTICYSGYPFSVTLTDCIHTI